MFVKMLRSLESIGGSHRGLLGGGPRGGRDDGDGDDGKDDLHGTIMDMAQYSSLHGMGWYAVTSRRCCRFTIVFVSVVLMLFMPLFIAYELRLYLGDDSVHKNQHTYRADSIDYPNITICNPRFFKNDYLRAHNISNDLANYMMLALDTTVRKHVDFMSMSFPDGSYIKRLERLEEELQEVLRVNKLDNLLDLFYLVADRYMGMRTVI